MGSIPQDLIDPKQIALYDAIDRLSGFRDIDLPELIVIGDQSNGKSSVLEAIARFQFPVRDSLCTRFPIKLILRRSQEERAYISITPGPSRTAEGEKELLEFARQITLHEDLKPLIERAATVMKVPSTEKKFSDDVLIIKRYGPSLPCLSLVDLPGLFRVETENQDRASRAQVEAMVERYIKSQRNILLLIVSAQSPFNTHTAPETVQRLLRDDPGLAERVVGVLTCPDMALSPDEAIGLLKGRVYSELNHPWMAVRNQTNGERKSQETLEERDRKEEVFFCEGRWRSVPQAQKGIRALRMTLKDVLWAHTRHELRGLIEEVRREIVKSENAVAGFSQPRDTEEAQRKYLSKIVGKFQKLVREGVDGSYRNEECEELHLTQESCPDCTPFFPRFGDNSPESQEKRLCSRVRSLCRAFTIAMRRFGKTKIVVYDADGSVALDGAGDDEELRQQSQPKPPDSLPPSDVIKRFYTHKEPCRTDPKSYERYVDEQIEQWRSDEPRGEPSHRVYTGLFEEQSKKWLSIAKSHLVAIWESVRRFVELALAAACDDPNVRDALKKHTIDQLEKLEREATKNMKSLLLCHGHGMSGFYDSFIGIQRIQPHTRDLAGRLANSLLDGYENAATGKSGGFDSWYQNVGDALLNTFLPKSGLFINDLVQSELIGMVRSTLTQLHTSSNTSPVAQGAAIKLAAEVGSTASKRVIEHVETYYEISMLAFVGYVNALVIGKGILQNLPDTILTHRLIEGLDVQTVKQIAGETTDVTQKREKEKQNLEVLREVLDTLTAFRE